MGNRKTGHVEIADGKAATGLEYFDDRRTLSPIDVLGGAAAQIDRQGTLRGFNERRKASRVIAMLMGDKNGIQIGYVFANSGEPLANLAPAEASIDEDTGAAGSNERRVARTGGREDADLNYS